jgi:hypothetical protein
MTSLSAPVQAVLELFKGPLADVRFADVDAAGLANLAAAVDSAATEVAQQEAQLAELRQALVERQDALLLLAQRAVAYARVYAEHDEALTEQLSRITLPRATKPRKAGAAKAPGEASAPVEAAPVEIESAAVAPALDDAPDTTEAQVEEAASAPAIVGSRKTKRRLGPPRDAQSRPS